MSKQVQLGDPATEWRRSNPDIVVYLPKGGGFNDTDNEHFLVFESSEKNLLAMWTQSSCEGHGDNHIVIARSTNNVTWSKPKWIAGTHPGTKEPQASWAFPIVSRQGRIYCFYVKDVLTNISGMIGHPMGCFYSDDDGHTWIQGDDIPFPRVRFDNPDPRVGPEWIVFQKPIRDSQGRWIVGYTYWVDPAMYTYTPSNWCEADSGCKFMRFDNIDDGPDPNNIQITHMLLNGKGLTVPYPLKPAISVAQEPSIVLLPDGRIFTTMRTLTGYIWYSISEDDGESWRQPEVLRYKDGGEPIKQPLAPCPIYTLKNGRYLLLFHNNDGRLGSYSQFKSHWEVNQANFIRHPAFIAVGEFRANTHQSIWFSKPKQILDTDGIPVGPKGTAEIATYTSLTEYKGKRVLWYPDRKYYLLGKYITDELLADMVVE